jgi:Cu-processing system ATP-binding protein
MIRLEGIEKSYGRRKVLKGVDLELPAGVVSGVLGPNACGKTTLIKCILGLAVPEHGQIFVDGLRVGVDAAYRERIGYMPQYPDFPENLRVGELIRMLEDLRGRPAPLKNELIPYFGLAPVLRQPFGQLSGGTRQKVSALTAFMFDAPVLILDEPTAGLDPLSVVKFKERLGAEAARGKTILLVSHIMTELEQLASHLAFIVDGQVQFSGPLSGLKSRTGEPSLERAITRLAEGPMP